MNYAQYLEDYFPEEEPNNDTAEVQQDNYYEVQQNNYYGQVTCIDRQIAELEARKNALLHGYCFTCYMPSKPYLDPYNLDENFIVRG